MNNSSSKSSPSPRSQIMTTILMAFLWKFVRLWMVVTIVVVVVVVEANNDHDDNVNVEAHRSDNMISKSIKDVKLQLWSRGAFSFAPLEQACLKSKGKDEEGDDDCWQQHLQMARFSGPVRKVRMDWIQQQQQQKQQSSFLSFTACHEAFPSWMCLPLRGGASNNDSGHDTATALQQQYQTMLQHKIHELGQVFGPDFIKAMELNQKEHDEDCRKSCDLFYCAPPNNDDDEPLESLDDVLQRHGSNNETTTIASLSMGAVPPEDFAELFGFPLDLIKVTQNVPLFSKEEAARVIENAEAEGVAFNEYKSGKYRLGGDWLDNLPKTREWFNQKLQSTFFPLLTRLFPEIVTSPSILRAHSVSLLKYNASHPRTDVHIDNGILAMTLAMTPRDDYVGGGTFFEHMGVEHVLHMDVGHGTFRPGSVRHGGHRVTDGTRYILGAFLLLEDKVEHVRRLKNRGSALRRQGDFHGAVRHFEWALALNPKCTTCLKDWAEILLTQKKFVPAEQKIRIALELLENKDSDALFTLGVLLSEQGRDDESIVAYLQSVELNSEDAELCFNLGVKFGAQGKAKEELELYERAIKVDPTFGPAWLNLGTALAETGNLEEAEAKFLRALEGGVEVVPKALMNLALLYHSKANSLAMSGNLPAAKVNALQASEYADRSKELLDQLVTVDDETRKYISQFKPLRLQCHRLLGQIHAGQGDLASCEKEFRAATTTFPNDVGAWQMLKRALELQGKSAEVEQVMNMMTSLADNL